MTSVEFVFIWAILMVLFIFTFFIHAKVSVIMAILEDLLEENAESLEVKK